MNPPKNSTMSSSQIVPILPTRAQPLDEIYAPEENTLEILVTDPKTEEDSKGNRVTTYAIKYTTTMPSFGRSESSVRRRYSEFEKLRRELERLNQKVDIPPLPGKLFRAQFTDEAIEKRKTGLQGFLNAVATHPLLLSAPGAPIQKFLQDPKWSSNTQPGLRPQSLNR